MMAGVEARRELDVGGGGRSQTCSTHYFCILVMLVKRPLSLYVDSSSDEVCSLSGCCCDEIVLRGSDSTMMLRVSAVGANSCQYRRTRSPVACPTWTRRSQSRRCTRRPAIRKLITERASDRRVRAVTCLVRREDIVTLSLAGPLQQHLVVRVHDNVVDVERST